MLVLERWGMFYVVVFWEVFVFEYAVVRFVLVLGLREVLLVFCRLCSCFLVCRFRVV